MRPDIEKENRKSGAVEITKMLAIAWKNIGEEDKAVYEAQHQVAFQIND